MHTLSIKIDDRLVFFGAGIDDRNIRPYICMDYEEEVTLLSRKSLLVSISDTPKSVNTKELWIVDSNLASVDGAVLSRKRIADSPNAGASTLCTTKFNQGWVYTWSVQVKNVAKMYVGVAKGNTDSLIHNSPESPVEGDEVMAVRNDGGICNKTGWNCHINCINSPTFRSGQTLEVTVDMPEQCLSIRIDGVLYLMVHNADLADFQPYICSCGSEVVVLPYPSCQERFFFLDKSASWKWNESDFCEVTQETVMKKMGSHSYSGVVGSEELEEEGVWNIKVESNDQEIAQRLPVVTPNDDGVTALHLTVSVGRPDIVKALLRFDEMGKLMEKEFLRSGSSRRLFPGTTLGRVCGTWRRYIAFPPFRAEDSGSAASLALRRVQISS